MAAWPQNVPNKYTPAAEFRALDVLVITNVCNNIDELPSKCARPPQPCMLPPPAHAASTGSMQRSVWRPGAVQAVNTCCMQGYEGARWVSLYRLEGYVVQP